MTHKIIVKILDGVIQDITDIPDGVVVEVQEYDGVAKPATEIVVFPIPPHYPSTY